MRTTLLALLVLATASCHTSPSRDDHNSGWNCSDIALQASWIKFDDRITDADQARKLANAILCLPRTKDVNDYINAHLDQSILTSSYGTGDLEEERDTLIPAQAKDRFGGYADSPDFTYTALLDDEGRILLDAQNEACVITTVLRYRRQHGWVISEHHDACD